MVSLTPRGYSYRELVLSGTIPGHKSEFQGGRKGPKKTVDHKEMEHRQRHWRNFKNYLERRYRDRKLDVVVDGANVGYFDQNFGGSPKHVDYFQIDWIINYFLRRKMSGQWTLSFFSSLLINEALTLGLVLVVIHTRHFGQSMMPKRFEPLTRSWRDKGVLYCTPHGMNDDWFWLHAALSAGPGTLVVTNDEMRDHHFQMLAPRSFLRWKDRHQVHFSFGAWEVIPSGDERRQAKERKVILSYPEIYSRRIQRLEDGLVVPLPKRGDERRYLDGMHVEKDAPENETYLCIRPNLVSTASK